MLPPATKKIIAYKLAVELLAFILLGSIGFFLLEMILPGFVSSRINFSYPYIAILIALIPLIYLAPSLGNTPSSPSPFAGIRPRTLFGISLVITLLLGNDMHGLPLWESLCILLLVFLITFSLLTFLFGAAKKTA